MEASENDIAEAKKSVDVVVISMHWGLHYTPAALATYQVEVAHAAIDAGADLIVGTHPHIPKGIEIYKGKVIAYSLCNFAMDNYRTAEDFERQPLKELVKYYPNRRFDKDYPTYTFPFDSRKTILLKCRISKDGVQRVSFVPVYINNKGQPEILTRSDAKSLKVFDYMSQLCEEFRTKLSFDGDEVTIHAD